MAVGSQEFYELVAMFDREFKGSRLDKESKDMWPKGYVYQHGEVNQLFLAYRRGFAYGTAVGRTGTSALPSTSPAAMENRNG